MIGEYTNRSQTSIALAWDRNLDQNSKGIVLKYAQDD